MIPGLIVGEIRDYVTGLPVEGALVGLNHITGDSSRNRGRVATYDANGAPTTNVYTTTGRRGLFTLYFAVDPLSFAEVTGSHGYPAFRLNIMRPRGPYGYGGLHGIDGQLVPVISLRAIAEGRLPILSEVSSLGGTIAKLALQIANKVRDFAGRADIGTFRTPTLRLPNMFLNPGRPSPEFVQLLGATEAFVR